MRLVSNSPETNDLPEISLVGRGYYRDLLAVNDDAGGARLHASGRRPAHLGMGRARRPRTRSAAQGTMHSKFAVIDGQRGLVGSYNLDPRSEKLNSETAVVFLQPDLAHELRRKLLQEDLRYAREITPAEAALFEAPDERGRAFPQVDRQDLRGTPVTGTKRMQVIHRRLMSPFPPSWS